MTSLIAWQDTLSSEQHIMRSGVSYRIPPQGFLDVVPRWNSPTPDDMIQHKHPKQTLK